MKAGANAKVHETNTEKMILATDVDYREDKAIAAGVLFQHWNDPAPSTEIITPIASVAEYEPGRFYKRELPCLLELLKQLAQLPECIVIDGYVYLGNERKAGLGKHLYEALQGRVPIIGVAKTRFQDTPQETEVYRGGSTRALYVTAIGLDEAEAKALVPQMHGQHRIPSLLKRVDQLSKTV